MISLGFYSFGRGGTGKTTLAVASTVLASLAGWRVLLVDIGDANNSSAKRLSQSLKRLSTLFS
ncbi:nucleotide-binding protein [Infirmifilum sp. SLHALR2]